MPDRYAEILSTGRYVPQRVITNAEMDTIVGEPVGDWLVANVGIEQRHVMAADETTSDLALAAATQALERAGVSAEELDLLIVASDTPDYISPGTSAVLQAKLGAVNAGTFDVNCACASWVTAADNAARQIMTDPDINYVLVVGAYAMTRFVDWTDKKTCTLFADGAGAALLGATDEPGFLAGRLASYGQYANALGIFDGGATNPATPQRVTAEGKPHVAFVQRMPATFNVEHWPKHVHEALEKAGLGVEDADFFLFTQLNLRTIEAVMAELEQPMAKTHWIMDKWGYTGSACIPMVLDDALAQDKIHPGDTVVMCASGGGIAMAVSVWRM